MGQKSVSNSGCTWIAPLQAGSSATRISYKRGNAEIMQRLWKIIWLIAVDSPDHAIMQTLHGWWANQPINQVVWNDLGFEFTGVTHEGMDTHGNIHDHPVLIWHDWIGRVKHMGPGILQLIFLRGSSDLLALFVPWVPLVLLGCSTLTACRFVPWVPLVLWGCSTLTACRVALSIFSFCLLVSTVNSDWNHC